MYKNAIFNKIYIILFLNMLIFLSHARTQTRAFDTTYTVVLVMPSQSFYLDSRFISSINGHSRITLPVNLPEGTVKWYYSFSANDAKNEPLEWVSLAAQLSKYWDKTGTVAEVLNRVMKPTGTAVCDISTLDTEGGRFFENKEDKSWNADPMTSRTNITAGVVEGIASKRQFLIGLSNPSLKAGINVKIEVSAVVLKRTAIVSDEENGWTLEKKNEMIARLRQMFTVRDIDKKAFEETSVCVIQKMAKTVKINELAHKTEPEVNILLHQIQTNCIDETHNTTFGNEQKHLIERRNMSEAARFKKQFSEAATTLQSIINDGYGNSDDYKNAAECQLYSQHFEDALRLSSTGLALNTSDKMPFEALKAHSLLLMNRVKDAEKIYMNYRNDKAWKQMVLDGFDTLIGLKIFNSNYENIKKRLK